MPYRQGKKWRAVVTYMGKRYQKLFRNKRDAVEWESSTRKDLAKTEKLLQTGMDLVTFCTKYLDYATRYSEKTYEEKKALCRRIIMVWGQDCIVQQVTPDMVLSFLDEQANTRSANASNRDRKNLLAMWNWGIDIFDFHGNPVVKIKKRPHDRKAQYTPPTKDILRVLAVADREEKIFLDCYLQTGARRSEIFRWTWNEDINFERREYRLGTRKTRDGSMEYEWFPMSDDLYEALKWQWQNRQFKESPYVFVSVQPGPNYGKPFKVRRRFLAGLCDRARVKPFGFHGLRRYVASVLADTHKVSAKTIQRILRHKNIQTTERYIHNINNDLKDTLNLLSGGSIPQEDTPTQQKSRPKK